MGKFNYKTGGSEAGTALMQTGAIMAGMIGSNQLLDFTKIFKSQYAANPGAFYFKHQGAIKAGLGAGSIFLYTALTNKKMHPVLKALLIGLTLQGAFQEVRALTSNASGISPIEQLGADNGGASMADLDELMRKASLGGNGNQDGQTGIGSDQPSVDLMQNATTGIGWASYDDGFQNFFMKRKKAA